MINKKMNRWIIVMRYFIYYCQMDPDPEFPTVVFPNPEEGKSALVSVLRVFDVMEAF